MNSIARFIELTADWRWLARRYGLKAALPVIAGELAGLPYRRLRFLLLRRSLVSPFPPVYPQMELEIRRFEARDLPGAARIHRPSEARLCQRRLEAGHIGLAALHAGQLAGYAWASSANDAGLERVPLTLAPGEALCTDAYTAPDVRRLGVQSALTLARFQLLKGLGFKDALSYILFANKPSLVVWQKKLGSELVGDFTFIRFGPWIKIEGSGEFLSKRMHPVQRGRETTGF
jgi:GNAT superfamily N-acetyltransferase